MKLPTEIRIISPGRIKGRDEHFAKPMTFYLHKSLDKWVDDHAKGNGQLTLNYLIARGILAMQEDDQVTFIDDMNDVLSELGFKKDY